MKIDSNAKCGKTIQCKEEPRHFITISCLHIKNETFQQNWHDIIKKNNFFKYSKPIVVNA